MWRRYNREVFIDSEEKLKNCKSARLDRLLVKRSRRQNYDKLDIKVVQQRAYREYGYEGVEEGTDIPLHKGNFKNYRRIMLLIIVGNWETDW